MIYLYSITPTQAESIFAIDEWGYLADGVIFEGDNSYIFTP